MERLNGSNVFFSCNFARMRIATYFATTMSKVLKLIKIQDLIFIAAVLNLFCNANDLLRFMFISYFCFGLKFCQKTENSRLAFLKCQYNVQTFWKFLFLTKLRHTLGSKTFAQDKKQLATRVTIKISTQPC